MLYTNELARIINTIKKLLKLISPIEIVSTTAQFASILMDSFKEYIENKININGINPPSINTPLLNLAPTVKNSRNNTI